MQIPELVNWPLLKNPVNWVIVILMLIIAGFALDVLLSWVTTEPQPS